MRIACGLLMLGVVVVLNTGSALAGEQQVEEKQVVEVTMYFTDYPTLLKSDCSATLPVKRNVHVTGDLVDSTLRLLFQGVTADEKKMNLSDSFGYGSENPLIDYYIGVTVHDGVAIVNFREGAMHYLNAAMCLQSAVKAPIEKTLLGFPEIHSVEYAIDGKVVEEFDV